ncbi:MAG: flagellar biosynthesis protein FlgA, partial [Chloroflexi bacterium]|nr:flagellar biosynthesis protein FlgA [Chloroflexota bacterium]
KHLADAAGVVYTPVDGDQHGLLTGLVRWARGLGLEVIAGGKARPYDFVYDEAARTVMCDQQTVTLSAESMQALAPITSGNAVDVLRARRELLAEIQQVGEPDVCEAVNAANATALLADIPELHAPIVRTTEIAEVLCTAADGGVLARTGVIDVVNVLRRADEPGLGGGVFTVVAAGHARTWAFMREKGLLMNARGSCGLLYRPYHLLGVETPVTLLAAVLLGLPTGGSEVLPRVDLAARTTRDFRAGEVVPMGHHVPLQPLMLPAVPVGDDHALPYFLAVHNQLMVDVPAGTILTYNMLEEPPESRLWALRRAQDRTLLHT